MLNEIINHTLDSIRKNVHTDYNEKWIQTVLDDTDIDNIEREFSSVAPFDPLKIRQKALKNWHEKKIELKVFECRFARVIIFFQDSQISEKDIPFFLWSQILSSFIGYHNMEKVRIYFVATDIPRKIPNKRGHGIKIGPEHINGGYCSPCRKIPCIYIYRWEDATRVLIHELLHAFCTDNFEKDLDIIESRTETWAEILWCCYLSGGSEKKAREFIQEQIKWIINQNNSVIEFIGDNASDKREFPWRYTIGREEVLKRWCTGFIDRNEDRNCFIDTHDSLRLTSPDIAKKGAKILGLFSSVKLI